MATKVPSIASTIQRPFQYSSQDIGSRNVGIYRADLVAKNKKAMTTYLQQLQTAQRADALAADYQTSYDEAKAVNEQRYAEILKGYEDRYSGALVDLEGLGEQGTKDIQTAYQKLSASTSQGLINTGLHSTTIAPSMQRGVARGETDALARLNEQIRREKIGYTTGLSGEKLAFQERREDTYPDFNALLQLSQGLGQA